MMFRKLWFLSFCMILACNDSVTSQSSSTSNPSAEETDFATSDRAMGIVAPTGAGSAVVQVFNSGWNKYYSYGPSKDRHYIQSDMTSAGNSLPANTVIRSKNARYHALLLSNGALAIYDFGRNGALDEIDAASPSKRVATPTLVWSSSSATAAARKYLPRLRLESNCDIVIFSSPSDSIDSGQVIWRLAASDRAPNEQASLGACRLRVSDDGKLVRERLIWYRGDQFWKVMWESTGAISSTSLPAEKPMGTYKALQEVLAKIPGIDGPIVIDGQTLLRQVELAEKKIAECKKTATAETLRKVREKYMLAVANAIGSEIQSLIPDDDSGLKVFTLFGQVLADGAPSTKDLVCSMNRLRSLPAAFTNQNAADALQIYMIIEAASTIGLSKLTCEQLLPLLAETNATINTKLALKILLFMIGGVEGEVVAQALKVMQYSRHLDKTSDFLSVVSDIPPELLTFAASKLTPPDDALSDALDKLFQCRVKPKYPN